MTSGVTHSCSVLSQNQVTVEYQLGCAESASSNQL